LLVAIKNTDILTMNDSMVSRFSVQLMIVIFWGLLFFGCLYVPKFLYSFSADSKSINVATWTDMLDEDMIKKFEQQTGIKVNISYFDNNDELLVKMRATKGQGYDLIIPSDHTVELLVQDNLLKRLDRSKITIWDRIEPRLLGAYFDPENQFSIPYYWGIYGIGIDKDFFESGRPKASWDLVFKHPQKNAKISMLDNPREAILLAALYLYGPVEHVTTCMIEEIKKLLIDQKKWVEAYTEFRADYLLLSTTCPIVVSTTPTMFRLMGIQKNIEFLVPSEGTFMTTDNWVIPQASLKEEFVYSFINFLYKPETIAHHFNVFTFIPATIDLHELLEKYPSILAAYAMDRQKLFYFKNILSKNMLNDVWIALKAS
jgi:spermidine/putrescine transport system substrate-binding protein